MNCVKILVEMCENFCFFSLDVFFTLWRQKLLNFPDGADSLQRLFCLQHFCKGLFFECSRPVRKGGGSLMVNLNGRYLQRSVS